MTALSQGCYCIVTVNVTVFSQRMLVFSYNNCDCLVIKNSNALVKINIGLSCHKKYHCISKNECDCLFMKNAIVLSK